MRLFACLALLLPAALAAQDDAERLRALPTDDRVLAVGASRSGALTTADARLESWGPHVQAWSFRPGARTVTLDLVSDDFDAMLLVVGPGLDEPLRDDDGGGGCNSRLTHAFGEGEYRVVVTSFSFGDAMTGAFTLSASSQPGPLRDGGCDLLGDEGDWDEGWSDVTVAALEALPVAGRLRRGDSLAGTLDGQAADIGSGRRGLAFDVTGPAGGQLTLDLTSPTFDTYLYVVHPHHAEPLADDDAGGACNSRLTLTFPEGGRVRAVVSAFGGDVTGPFVLRADQTPGPARQGSCGAASRFDPAAVAALVTAGRVTVGETREGELTPDDAQLDDYRADIWEIEGHAGATAVIELRSREFDAYLGVTGPGILGALTNDDGAGRCNSRLLVTFEQAGTYRIIATTFRENTLGQYTLAVLDHEPPMEDGSCSFARESARRLAELPVTGTAEIGGLVAGTLDPSDPALSGGSRAEVWTLEVRAGEVYTVDLVSDDFDTYLMALDADGGVEEDDDCGAGTGSQLVLRPSARGRWRLVASSFVEAEGAYTLQVTRGEPDGGACAGDGGLWDLNEGVEYDDVPVQGRVQVGDEYRGRLTSDDVQLLDGTYATAFELSGRSGETVTIDLVSDDFDAYLLVLGRGLPDLLSDDDSGGACNSRITMRFPESGTYQVVVNTLLSDRTGDFVLRVSREPGPVADGPCDLE